MIIPAKMYGKLMLTSNKIPPSAGPIIFPKLVYVEFMPATNPCSFPPALDKNVVSAGRSKSNARNIKLVTIRTIIKLEMTVEMNAKITPTIRQI